MVFAAMLLAAMQVGPPALDPTPEGIALGERLAAAGTLGVLLPLMERQETEAQIAAHPELTGAEQARLRALMRDGYAAARARTFAVEGRRYAELLSVADLRALVAASDAPAAQRLRRALPHVIVHTMADMAGTDPKRDALATLCRETGKVCAK